MSKVDKEEFAALAEEVLGRLSRDKQARHLWHWRTRPGCADEPIGPSRRFHLTTLLGLLGGSALAGLGTACRDTKKVAECGDDPCSSDGGPNDAAKDAAKDGATDALEDDVLEDAPAEHCADDPCATDAAPDTTTDATTDKDCADDPCGCADDPCACADDPCGCADDPCSCADDPCACADDPC